MFVDLPIKGIYRTKKDDINKDFFIPLLKECKQYDRGTGFFSLTALINLSEGLIPYINKDEVKCVEYQNHSQTCQKCAECSVHVFATCGNEIKNKIKVNFYDENKQETRNIQNIIPIIKSSPEYIQKEWERIFENFISWFCYCKLESRA